MEQGAARPVDSIGVEIDGKIIRSQKHHRSATCEGEAQRRESVKSKPADAAKSKMTDPLICAVMITNNRPAMARRAVRDFNRQTYNNKLLFVLDTAKDSPGQAASEWEPVLNGSSIGTLRNVANAMAMKRLNPDILINWDDDDVSHPNRIASQVRQLQTTLIDQRPRGGIEAAGAVGYQDLLWWNSVRAEAWVYDYGGNHYCLGTSLCYWPHFWKSNPFPERNIGEWPIETPGKFGYSSFVDGEPMIIGEWHGKNGANAGTEPSREPWQMEETHWSNTWKRVPEWDERLKARMALESAH
jgi:glycosyltransferase involved in cell wall biosynthesis